MNKNNTAKKAATLAAAAALATGCGTTTVNNPTRVERVNVEVPVDEFRRTLGNRYVDHAQEALSDFAISDAERTTLSSFLGSSTSADPVRESRIRGVLEQLALNDKFVIPLGTNGRVIEFNESGLVRIPSAHRGAQTPQLTVQYDLNGDGQADGSGVIPAGHAYAITAPQPLSAYGIAASITPEERLRHFSRVTVGLPPNGSDEVLVMNYFTTALGPRVRQAGMIALTGYERVPQAILGQLDAAVVSDRRTRMTAMQILESLFRKDLYTNRTNDVSEDAEYRFNGNLPGLTLRCLDSDGSDGTMQFVYGVPHAADLASASDGAMYTEVTLRKTAAGGEMVINEIVRNNGQPQRKLITLQYSAERGQECLDYARNRWGALHNEVRPDGS